MGYIDDSSWWPTINRRESAVKAMHYGSGAAAVGAILTAAVGVAALVLDQPIFGMDEWVMLDAALFAIVAWRVYRLSLPWSIVGLVFFSFERLAGFMRAPHHFITLALGTIVFLPYYLNAVRGALYLRATKTADHSAAPAIQFEPASETTTSGSSSVQAANDRMPVATNDEHNEFLAYMRRGDRKFQKARFTLQDEFAAWLKDRRKKSGMATAAK